jgi:hypothetical protein
MFQVMGRHQRLLSRVVHLPNRQRTSGTRRVRQLEHVRARAYTLGTPQSANLQAKRDRHCPAVSASTAPNIHGKEGVDGSSPSEGLAETPANQPFDLSGS